MFTPRRFYIYAVSAISLNAVAWAAISLLRNLIISKFQPSITGMAFQLAVLLIGMPVFLVHWMWGQRLSKQDEEERGAVLRRIYLYGMQSAFLVPIIHSTFAVLTTLAFIPTGMTPRAIYPRLSSGETILYYLLAIIVLGVLWYYHHRVNIEDTQHVPEAGAPAVVRRLYVLSFSGAGLTMTTIAVISLVRWLMFQVGGTRDEGFFIGAGPKYEVVRLVIGLVLWLCFWTWTERLFNGPDEEERESVLRKFYLYLTIFLSALITVTSITYILEGFLRRLLDVPPSGFSESDIRIPLSIIIGVGIVWAYHAYVLWDDTKSAVDIPRQHGIKRLYLYLIAGIGLAAFLVGISGDLSVLIRSLEGGSFDVGLKRQLTWFAAVTIAGLPVWFLPWEQAQNLALLSGPEGSRERRSVVRKIYLYFFIFIATMTVLSSVIFIVFRILSMLLGEPGLTLSELVQPIAYSIIAVGVWLYHGYLLRGDHKLSQTDQQAQYKDIQIVVVDLGEREQIQLITDRLKKEILGASISTISLTEGEKEVEAGSKTQDLVEKLHGATIILGPWMMAVSGWGGNLVSHDIAKAILKSPARKILIPSQADGWEWTGVELIKKDMVARQVVSTLGQVLKGEEIKVVKPLSLAAIIGIIITAIVLLTLLSIPLIYLFVF
jgi:hypothetical protein